MSGSADSTVRNALSKAAKLESREPVSIERIVCIVDTETDEVKHRNEWRRANEAASQDDRVKLYFVRPCVEAFLASCYGCPQTSYPGARHAISAMRKAYEDETGKAAKGLKKPWKPVIAASNSRLSATVKRLKSLRSSPEWTNLHELIDELLKLR